MAARSDSELETPPPKKLKVSKIAGRMFNKILEQKPLAARQIACSLSVPPFNEEDVIVESIFNSAQQESCSSPGIGSYINYEIQDVDQELPISTVEANPQFDFVDSNDIRVLIKEFADKSQQQLEEIRKRQEATQKQQEVVLNQQQELTASMGEVKAILAKLNAKIDLIGTEKSSTTSISGLLGEQAPFAPITNEEELKSLEELAKDDDFLGKTVSFIETKIPKIKKDGKSVGLSIIDFFGTREFWTLCSYTGAGKSDNDEAVMKVNMSKYVNFMRLIHCSIRNVFPDWKEDETKTFLQKTIMNNAKVRFVRDQLIRLPMSRASGLKKNDDIE